MRILIVGRRAGRGQRPRRTGPWTLEPDRRRGRLRGEPRRADPDRRGAEGGGVPREAGPRPERRRMERVGSPRCGSPAFEARPGCGCIPTCDSPSPAGGPGPGPRDRWRGRPGLPLLLYVHFRRTSSRCHRSSVCGRTRNSIHRSREIIRLAAATTTRSSRRRSSLRRCRRRSLTSWRRTAFSSSMARTEEPRPSQPRVRRMNRSKRSSIRES
jgi:hypothetical protein